MFNGGGVNEIIRIFDAEKTPMQALYRSAEYDNPWLCTSL